MIRILGPALVLKQFATDPQGGRVYIVGRQPGFMGWLLSAMGVDANTELNVQPTDVTFRQASLFGETASVCPVSRLSSATAGYAKPVEYLVLAVLLSWTIIIPLILIVKFFLDKRMFVAVETSGGTMFSIVFERSIIEGVDVNQDKAKEVVQILQRNILASAARDQLHTGPAAQYALPSG